MGGTMKASRIAIHGLCLFTASLVLTAGAFAQTKFDVKISGDVFFEAGIVQQRLNADTQSTEFRNRWRLSVMPVAAADNGLTYGARLRVLAARGDRIASNDYAYLFASGRFGEIRGGDMYAYNDDYYITPPIDYRLIAIQDPATAFLGAAAGTPSAQRITTANGRTVVQGADVASLYGGATSSLSTPKLTETATASRLMYISPSFAGLTMSVGYVPRTDSFATDVNRAKFAATAPLVQTAWRDVVEVAGLYRGRFGDTVVNAGGGFHAGRSIPNAQATASGYHDLRAWQAGLQVGQGALLFGATYTDFGKSGQTKAAYVGAAGTPSAVATGTPTRTGDSRVWAVGAQYTTDPWILGLGYSNGRDPGALTVAGDRKLAMYTLGAAYNVAAGFRIGSEFVHFRSISDQTTAGLDANDRGNVLLLRSQLIF